MTILSHCNVPHPCRRVSYSRVSSTIPVLALVFLWQSHGRYFSTWRALNSRTSALAQERNPEIRKRIREIFEVQVQTVIGRISIGYYRFHWLNTPFRLLRKSSIRSSIQCCECNRWVPSAVRWQQLIDGNWSAVGDRESKKQRVSHRRVESFAFDLFIPARHVAKWRPI